MKERHSARYGVQLLPNSLRKVMVTWGNDTAVESDVANFCAHGMKIEMPLQNHSARVPKKNEMVKIKLPFVQVWLTGMCVYITVESETTASVGVYFYVPIEQNYLNKLLSNNLNVPLQECSFVCHEWEEFVEKLCNSEDPDLHNIGVHEQELLRAQL